MLSKLGFTDTEIVSIISQRATQDALDVASAQLYDAITKGIS